MDDRRERGIRLLDAIKVCIVEHPIVVQWITEILDRKTESQTKETVLCQTCKHWIPYECTNDKCHYEPKDEPQTEDEILREQCRAFMGIVEQTERKDK